MSVASEDDCVGSVMQAHSALLELDMAHSRYLLTQNLVYRSGVANIHRSHETLLE